MSDIEVPQIINKYPPVLHDQLNAYWQDWLSAHSLENVTINSEELLDIFSYSDFIARSLIKSPIILETLLQSNDLKVIRSRQIYQQILSSKLTNVTDDNQLMSELRQFRQYEMIRIAWRDLKSLATTTQTLNELSWLADACIRESLEYLFQDSCEKIGIPKDAEGKTIKPLVIGMGKLGAYELNFSSDIDLIFAFSEEGETVGKRAMANSEFFTRLMQSFVTSLNKTTVDGFVFRVDTRLRPFGNSGPLIMSFSGIENYYQTQGRTWERYAMIKARVIFGEEQDIKELVSMLKPFVFRRYLDFGAFASIRKMKLMIANEINRKGLQHNIKLGEGGIREIEFIGQAFQLIRGGREPELQTRGIVDVLNCLQDMNDLPEETVQHLLESYEYLRKLENRLQMLGDEQTHLLPLDDVNRTRIYLAMGMDNWQQLEDITWQHRNRVHGYFEMVFDAPQLSAANDNTSEDDFYHAFWVGQLDQEDTLEQLTTRGFYQAQEIYKLITEFADSKVIHHIGDTARKRLDSLMPMILASIEQQKESAVVLERILKVIHSILKRSVYIALLTEYPMALSQLIRLCSASVLITNLLTRYPILLDDLLDPAQLYHLPDHLEMEQQLDIAASRYDEDDLEQQMDVLRHFKHSYTLKIAALDVAGDISVFEISSQLTMLAELILHRVYQMAWMDTVAKFGRPYCETEAGHYHPQLAVLAYGKLGGQELGYNSDLDIVFLHDSSGQQQMTDGERSVENTVFFIKMTQRIIHIMSSYTNAGRLYEIDTRLRPDGATGLLVSSLPAFEQYQLKQAWTWEHQALLRARIVVTNSQISAEFDRIRRLVLSQEREPEKLLTDVRDMRKKMRDHLGNKANNGLVHLKQDVGGLVDIEFIVQYTVLSIASQIPVLLNWSSMIELIDALVNENYWQRERADTLINCYRSYRAMSHERALDEADMLFESSELGDCREKIKAIWFEVLNEKL